MGNAGWHLCRAQKCDILYSYTWTNELRPWLYTVQYRVYMYNFEYACPFPLTILAVFSKAPQLFFLLDCSGVRFVKVLRRTTTFWTCSFRQLQKFFYKNRSSMKYWSSGGKTRKKAFVLCNIITKRRWRSGAFSGEGKVEFLYVKLQ